MHLFRTGKEFLLAFVVFSCLMARVTPLYADLPFFGSKPGNQLSSERESQINEYNERAIELFEEGRFKEAQEYWERAIELMERPGRRREYAEPPADENRRPDEELMTIDDGEDFMVNDIAGIYETAVDMFKKGKYVSSKKLFERVETAMPDYKATRNYLSILEHKIKREQQSLAGDRLRENAVSRRAERAEWYRILEQSEQELKNKMAAQAEPLYTEALAHYKSRDFKRAKEYFTEVVHIMPDYKDTTKYLERIELDIREEDQLQVSEQRKRELLARKKEQEEWQRVLIESEQKLQRNLAGQAEPLYQEALRHYKQREFKEAKNRFEEVVSIIPDYRSTEKYLERIDRDIKEEILLTQKRRALELKLKNEQEELVRKRAEESIRKEKDTQEQERLRQYQSEIAARRKERDEWLKILEESERERDRKLMEQAEYVYLEGIEFYKKRQFVQAKESFAEVEQVYPEYKSTQQYLARIDEDIAAERQKHIEDKQRELKRQVREKEVAERQQEEKEQLWRLQEEEQRLKDQHEKALARKKQREEWERMLTEAEMEHQRKMESEAEFVYKDAVRLFEGEQWERARDKFIETEQVLPDYKQTDAYLVRIDEFIQKRELRQQQALKDSIEQRKQERDLAYKNREERLESQRSAEEQEKEAQRGGRAEAIYKYALSLYRQQDYLGARQKFLEAQDLIPGYKATDKYLKRINNDMAKAAEERQHKQQEGFVRLTKEQMSARQKEEERLGRLEMEQERKRSEKLKNDVTIRKQERVEWERSMKEIVDLHQKRLEQQTEDTYQEAMRYFQAGWYAQAKSAFEETDAAIPGYKSSRTYITRADEKMKEEAQLDQKSGRDIPDIQERASATSTRGSGAGESEILSALDQAQMKQRKSTAARIYKSANQAYKESDYVRAKGGFMEVEEVYPDYKSTRKYLERIDEDIARAEEEKWAKQQKEFEDLVRNQRREEQQEHARVTSDGAEDSWQPEESTGYSGGSESEPSFWTAGIQSREAKQAIKQRKQKLSRETQRKYDEAVDLYNASQYIEAKLKFMEVDSLSPGYKATPQYLRRVDDEIARQQNLGEDRGAPKSRTSSVRSQETRSLNTRGRRDAVEQALLDIERAGFQKTLPPAAITTSVSAPAGATKIDWEQQIKRQREELREQRQQVQREYKKKFKESYAKAVSLFKSGAFQEANELFTQIDQLSPGYKNARGYLRKINARLATEHKEKSATVAQLEETQTRQDLIGEALDVMEQRM